MQQVRATSDRLDPVVAVPARNEERRLPALIGALADQTWSEDAGRRLPLVIVLNNCTDRSAAVVHAAAHRFPSLAIHMIDVVFDAPEAHVGTARRLAMETALDLCRAPERAALLTTDADAVPSRDWVAANLRHLRGGVDLVGGLIVGDPAEEARLGPDFGRRAARHKAYGRAIDRLASLIDPLLHDPWPRHHDHTGASIAVRADVYRDVGGLPAAPFREDVAFVDRVRAGGFLVRHPMDVLVHVSARLAGRAPGGMADCIKEWMRAASMGAPLLVEDPGRVLERLRRRRAMRDASGEASRACGRAEMLVPDEPDAPATMPVETAIEQAERMIADAEGDARAA